MYKVIPLITEIFHDNAHFNTEGCATFEMQNTGETTLYIDTVYKILPGEKVTFQPLGPCVIYVKSIPFRFQKEGDKTNELTVISSKYEAAH